MDHSEANWLTVRERAVALTRVAVVPDPTAVLAVQIATVGLARIHCLQEHLGDTPNAQMVVGPDATPSANSARCIAGFANGTRYRWRSSVPFVPVGFGPNACGICVVGLDEYPDIDTVLRRVSAARRNGLSIGDTRLQFDFGRRNHFIGVFEVSPVSSEMPHSHVALLHCSAPERRYEGAISTAPTAALVLETPAGPIEYLEGNAAHKFLEEFDETVAFAAAKRSLIASQLFPGGRILSNRVHQGCVGIDEIVVGAHVADDAGRYVYLLGLEASSYLYNRPPLATASYEALPADLPLLPHGGGARYQFLESSTVSIDSAGGLEIRLTTRSGSFLDVRSTQDLPYEYRGAETFDWCVEQGLCEPYCELVPQWCIRV